MSSLVEYHLEPREISDFIITYDHAHFHVHKYVLVQYSTYFSAVIKGNPKLGSIEVPTVCIYSKLSTINHSCFYDWVVCMYECETPLSIDDFRVDNQTLLSRKSWDRLMDCDQYFGCEKLQAQLRSITDTYIMHPDIAINYGLIVVLVRIQGKWPDMALKMIAKIGENLRRILGQQPLQECKVWRLLSSKIQQSILEIAAKHNQIDTVVPIKVNVV